MKLCDNTDHQENPSKVQMISLTKDFDYCICHWCVECQERDKNMIEYNVEELFKEGGWVIKNE